MLMNLTKKIENNRAQNHLCCWWFCVFLLKEKVYCGKIKNNIVRNDGDKFV